MSPPIPAVWVPLRLRAKAEPRHREVQEFGEGLGGHRVGFADWGSAVPMFSDIGCGGPHREIGEP